MSDNKLCLACQKDCKQSDNITINKCPNFKIKETKNDTRKK